MIDRANIRRTLHRAHLLVSAWRLHSLAQRLTGGGSWAETRDRMLAVRGLPVGACPDDALWAAGWAARLGRGLAGRRDTCLLRSMVAGALVADAPEVAVSVGFHRPFATGDLLDGHAWLCVANRAVPASGDRNGAVYEEAVSLPLERGR